MFAWNGFKTGISEEELMKSETVKQKVSESLHRPVRVRSLLFTLGPLEALIYPSHLHATLCSLTLFLSTLHIKAKHNRT
eukprot:6203128-Pleurochrysis_carterae.AAC.1